MKTSLKVLGHIHANLMNCVLVLSADRDLQAAVVEVIDHHQLETTASFSCPVTMEMAMSCTALVLERILSSAPEILDQQLALLLYGEIHRRSSGVRSLQV